MKSTDAPRTRDFMNRHVHTVTPGLSLAEVTAFLGKHRISSAPVVEEVEGSGPLLIGYISEADCLEYLANEIFFGNPAMSQTVQTMMKRHPVCVTPETDIFSLASVFVSHRYRHLPVVEEGRLLGIVSRRDILKALDQYYRQELAEQGEERFPPDLQQLINLRFVSRST